MSLFRGAREVRADSPTDSLPELFARRMSPSGGVPVTADSALCHSAVYECVDLIADVVSTMPVDDLRKGPNGLPTPAPVMPDVLRDPSDEVDAINWRRLVIVSWLLRGNAFGRVTEVDPKTLTVRRIELIHPDRVGGMKATPDSPTEYFLDKQPIKPYPYGDLWHAPGKLLTPGSAWGSSVLEHAQHDVALGLAARDFGAKFFNASGIPVAVLMNEKEVNEAGARLVKRRFMDALFGNREPVVMGDGWKYERVQINPNESQFLETIRANRAEIAGFFRVPPELIGAPSGSSMTYSNIESRGADLLRFCFGPWVVRLETALSGLVLPPDYVKLNVDSLLRADLNGRYDSYGKGIRGGWLSVNDVRRMEDEPPIAGGDEYLWPPYRAFPISDDSGEPVAPESPQG